MTRLMLAKVPLVRVLVEAIESPMFKVLLSVYFLLHNVSHRLGNVEIIEESGGGFSRRGNFQVKRSTLGRK